MLHGTALLVKGPTARLPSNQWIVWGRPPDGLEDDEAASVSPALSPAELAPPLRLVRASLRSASAT
jgi:hypothetical protein